MIASKYFVNTNHSTVVTMQEAVWDAYEKRPSYRQFGVMNNQKMNENSLQSLEKGLLKRS